MTTTSGQKVSREEMDRLVNESLKMQPITELSNQLTTNIDLAQNGLAIAEMLEMTDREIIHGSQLTVDHSHIRTLGLRNDSELLDKLVRLAGCLATQIKRHLDDQEASGQFRLVLSGCGTSGRLGFLCSQTVNEYVSQRTGRDGEKICEYVIAGDDYALVNSVESVEDKPPVGVQKLRDVIYQDSARPVKIVFIGITCGLSAPFVAGQLDYCMNAGDPNVLACGIIGFNTVEMTRKTNSVNERGQSFLDLMMEMKERERAEPDKYFILNPLIGPEPVTGSSRMKSGSATKIMLDMVTTTAFHLVFDSADDGQEERSSLQLQHEMLDLYEQAMSQVVYEPESKRLLGQLIDAGRDSLASRHLGGSINYLCDSVRLGLLCCVDASECVPTYGAAKRDIRGFVSASAPGRYLVNQDAAPDKAWSGFVRTCSSTWSQHILEDAHLAEEFKSKHCTLVIIDDQPMESLPTDLPDTRTVLSSLKSRGSEAQVFRINLAGKNGQERKENTLVLSNLASVLTNAEERVGAYFAQCLQELVLKLLINAISTGSHVLIGKTFKNIMIDVKVSNIKLYWRAVGIIGRFGATSSKTECEDLLLRSIYRVDTVSQEIREKTIEEHIETATGQEHVVPRALIMSLTACSHEQAVKLLKESGHSVRNCIFKLAASQQVGKEEKEKKETKDLPLTSGQ